MRQFGTYLCIFIDVNRVLHADRLGTEDFTVSLEAIQLKQAGSRQQLLGQERSYLRSWALKGGETELMISSLSGLWLPGSAANLCEGAERPLDAQLKQWAELHAEQRRASPAGVHLYYFLSLWHTRPRLLKAYFPQKKTKQTTKKLITSYAYSLASDCSWRNSITVRGSVCNANLLLA